MPLGGAMSLNKRLGPDQMLFKFLLPLLSDFSIRECVSWRFLWHFCFLAIRSVSLARLRGTHVSIIAYLPTVVRYRKMRVAVAGPVILLSLSIATKFVH